MKTPGEGGPSRGSTLFVHAHPGAFPVATTSYNTENSLKTLLMHFLGLNLLWECACKAEVRTDKETEVYAHRHAYGSRKPDSVLHACCQLLLAVQQGPIYVAGDQSDVRRTLASQDHGCLATTPL